MTDDTNFSGKTVLVVGGSSGIGNATAQAFRSRGAVVHVWGTRAGAADYDDSSDSDLTGLRYKQVDVSDFDHVANCAADFEALDVLVLCQGKVLYKRQEFEMAGFQQVLDVNLNSLMACATGFHPALAAGKGSLIIVSSTAAFHATRGNPAYGASKAAAAGLTRTLGQAWAADGIRVNGIAPGFVPTKMTRVTTENEKRAESTRAMIPLHRFGRPDEMAGVALFLASPLASYILGQTIIVDGGLLL